MARGENTIYIEGHDGHSPLHAFKNLSPDAFYDEDDEFELQKTEELATTSPLPDSTPTNYVSESSAAFAATTFGGTDQSLRQRIFIDTSKLQFEEQPETIILGNRELPAFDKHQEFEAIISSDAIRVAVVMGPTGSGKSTQFPQFAVNAGYEVVKITQPRRAAADNVGNRIELEIIKATNDSPDHPTVAIRTGGKKEGPSDAAITVTTEGYMLAAWQSLEAAANSGKKICVFLDEAHESSSDMEMLMALYKQHLASNPHSKLKVVIMSATLNAQFYADYFNDVEGANATLLEVEGRMFNVTKYERPNSNIKTEAIKAARGLAQRTNPDDPNGIWVFVPGKREIKDTIDEITARLPADIASQVVVLPFHAKLTEAEQQAAFQRYPGVKIIVSTNAGETSITDPHCAAVIDSGLARQMLLDEEQVTGLERYHISKDECTQRAGRTGRVCPGTYVLTRLDDDEEFVPFSVRNQSPIPEILRTDIVRHVLRTASFGYDIELLTKVPHPISKEVLERAKNILQMLGAFDENYQLTPLGLRMNGFPASASSARMMAEADRYNQNIKNYMSAIIASLEAGKLQYYAPDVEKRWQDLTEEDSSDMLAQLDLFIAVQGMTEQEMRDYDIDVNNHRRALEQYYKLVKQSGAEPTELRPATPAEKEDIINCILAGSVHSIYLSNSPTTYRQIGSQAVAREISNRSLVRSHPAVLVGDPYRAEYWRGGERREKHLIENVTATTIKDIGRVARHLCTWMHESFVLRGNNVYSRRGQVLFGQSLGLYEESPAQPSKELTKYLIDYALNNPGPNQKKLRKIKKDTARLAVRAGSHVEQLTQAQLEALIYLAIPDDLTDVDQIDNNLRLIMDEHTISLDSYVTPERKEEIEKNAPLEMTINGSILPVAYKTSGPELRIKNAADLAAVLALDSDIALRDGRMVHIAFDGKRYTLHQLQESFGSQR
jgi:HrpA-like RNA helicase